MPLSLRAETQLRQMLRDFRAAHAGTVIPTGAGKALEVWVLLKLAHTVHRTLSSNWSVTLRRGDGSLLPAGGDFNLPNGGSPIPASDQRRRAISCCNTAVTPSAASSCG
jgi:hypothetical protein